MRVIPIVDAGVNLAPGVLLLAYRLIFGRLNLPARGILFLWGLVAILVGVSTLELVRYLRHRTRDA